MTIHVQSLSPPPIQDDMFHVARKHEYASEGSPIPLIAEGNIYKKLAENLLEDEGFLEEFTLEMTQPWQDYFNLQSQRMTDIINYINTLP